MAFNQEPIQSWDEYKQLVLHELKDNARLIENLDKNLRETRELFLVEISNLKGRAAVWGAVSGGIFAGIISIIVALILK